LIFKRQANTRAARMAIDNFKMRIFGIGPLIKKTEIARFARTLGMLLANGVPMMQSLQASALTVQNEVLRDDIETISEDVASGTAFSKAITKSQNFPPFAVNMIAVGDESGQLEKALLKVAESCERDVTRAVSALTALVEPFVIIIMGSIVGFIVISMLLPIFQINLMAR
jgi:type II secretory pathway component PulF